MEFHWFCPYCNHDTTVNNQKHIKDVSRLTLETPDGYRELHVMWIVCPNGNCNKLALRTLLYESEELVIGTSIPPRPKWKTGKLLKQWNLIPQSDAKVFPDYVPKPIRVDYEEACAIKELSPKASATLSRRCLQGMIRDFFGVNNMRTLFEEIESIKEKVDPLTWDAIDATRNIGNIGAHMEKDINLIIDVDTNEAEALIKLIEILITDWYINKHEKEKRLKEVTKIGEEKKEVKRGK